MRREKGSRGGLPCHALRTRRGAKNRPSDLSPGWRLRAFHVKRALHMTSMLYTSPYEETKHSRGNWMGKTVFVARVAESGWWLDDVRVSHGPARHLLD